MAGHFFDDFQSSISFATISVVEFFTFHSSNLAIIREKRTPRIFGFENSDGKRYRKILCCAKPLDVI